MTPNTDGGLRPGERLLWTGEPIPEKDHGSIDRFLIPLFAVLLAIAAFFSVWLAMDAAQSGLRVHHLPFALVLLLADALSLYGYFFRFLIKRSAKADLAYGITDQGRVLISDAAAGQTYDFLCADLEHLKITEIDKYGIGTLYLAPKKTVHLLDNTGLDLPFLSDGRHIALFDIPNCKKVYQMILTQRRTSHG